MRQSFHLKLLGLVLTVTIVSGCDKEPKDQDDRTTVGTEESREGYQEELVLPKKGAPHFVPPSDEDIPDNEFGQVVRKGREIFMNTDELAQPYVGNSMKCVNCHLNQGRRANSAPLWAAYPMYPAYRNKTKKVDTLQERIQGCFMFSMNGTPPPQDSDIMRALVTYHYWMAKGAPTGVILKGRGYPELDKPNRQPSFAEGRKVYAKNCAICHGENGHGQKVNGHVVFPPLWGAESYNWGAGMHRVNTAAGFIKANMPLGRAGTLSDQEAWDVAYFMNSQERPQDPRFKESVAKTDEIYHDENCLYGEDAKGR